MSCYIVGNETLDRVVNLMVDGYASTADRTALGLQLQALNVQAFACRYPREPRPEPLPYTYTARAANILQAFKSLECLLYQCAEGDAAETDLFQRFDSANH